MHDVIRNKSSMQEETTAVCLKATEVAGEIYCLRHTEYQLLRLVQLLDW